MVKRKVKAVSPGAALLRGSRLFSMPKPLPPPPDFSLKLKHRSNTATSAYPTRLAVTTLPACRAVGDWGFKRELPLHKTTKGSIPLVRLHQVDSVEHITDYELGSPHTLAQRKFAELNLALMLPIQFKNEDPPPRSIFDPDADFTHLRPALRKNHELTRWRFKGPWLSGMSEWEFNRYAKQVVRPKRHLFQYVVKTILAKEVNDRANLRALEDPSIKRRPPISFSNVFEGALQAYMKKLRGDKATLFDLVNRFLDLAPLITSSADHMEDMDYGKPYWITHNPYSFGGPPRMHPSGGLSYLRTNSYLDNHPLYGPQEYHSPVKARVITPKSFVNNWLPKLGVAGFVAESVETQGTYGGRNLSRYMRAAAVEDLGLDKKGGAKIFVQPRFAFIDSMGRVQLKLMEVPSQAELVERERLGEADCFNEAAREAKMTQTAMLMRQQQFGSVVSYSSMFPQKTPLDIPPMPPRAASAVPPPQVGSPDSYGLPRPRE